MDAKFLHAHARAYLNIYWAYMSEGIFSLDVAHFIIRSLLLTTHSRLLYEGVSINNQPIPFSMARDGHDFHALFQYMFYTWVQNCTRIESFFNKILNVKHG